jgi:hypothetical protein
VQRAHQGLAQHDRRPGGGGFAQVQHDGARGAAGQLDVDGVYGMAVFDTDPGLCPAAPPPSRTPAAPPGSRSSSPPCLRA